MAIIYSYPKVTTPLATDVLVLTDTTLKAGKRKNNTKSLALSDLASFVISSTSAITGGGTLNTIPLWTPDGFKLGDSIITQAASGQGVTVTGQLDVTEDFNVTGSTELSDTLTVQGASTFSNVSFQGVVFDGGGNPGTAGQVLSSTGTGVEWISDAGGSVTGTGINNYFPIWTDGPNGVIGDSQLKQSSQLSNGLYQIRMENTDRFIINKPSSVTSGDPAFQVAQDGDPKVEFGWDDDGGGYGFLYNYKGFGWRFGAVGNNPELEITTTAGSEGVTITNNLTINGSTTSSGDLLVESGLKDGDATYGTVGQVLSTTGTGQNVKWIDAPGGGTTYNLNGAVSGANDFAIGLAGSDGTLDKVLLKAGTNITLTDNGSNGVTIDSSASVLAAESIVQPIIADGALVKGDPVYITGFNNGQNKNIVAKADSSDPAKMPVVGISDGTYANNGAGFMTAFGSFNGAFDTTGGAENWSVGDIIYVKPGGGLTNIKPGGTDLVQNIAIVSRVQQNTGELEVIALGRTNDVPNLPTGRLFVGTATNTSLASDVIYVDDTNDNVGIGTTSPNAASILHLVDTDAQLRIQQAGNTAFSRIFTGNNNALRFGVGTTGQTRITILSSDGNVGIGTTTPASKLEVDGGDIEVDDSASGLILRSPDGTRYRVTVANGGTLTVSAV